MGRMPIRLKAMRIIDSSLDPQYGRSLVVHFDRVFFDPVFDAQTFITSSKIAADFSLEVAIEAASEKPQYISRCYRPASRAAASWDKGAASESGSRNMTSVAISTSWKLQ